MLLLTAGGVPPPPGVPGAPPPPGFAMPNTIPGLKEKKKFKLDVQMRRMNWNKVTPFSTVRSTQHHT